MNKELLEKLRNYLLEVVAEYENEGVELSINEMHVYIQGTSEYDCPVVIYVNGEYVELPSENFEDNNIGDAYYNLNKFKEECTIEIEGIFKRKVVLEDVLHILAREGDSLSLQQIKKLFDIDVLLEIKDGIFLNNIEINKSTSDDTLIRILWEE
jgi:hypothetical protein